MPNEADLQINSTVYEWTVRTFSLVGKVLRVNIKLHHVKGQVEDGDIFLFNHFARFEAFIPQYLIYSVYSRSAEARRKHHTGAAFVALAVEGFKAAVLEADADGRRDRVAAWAEGLGLEGPEALLAAARKETSIVPSNITFYPIRITENLLKKGAELFFKGLSPRVAEGFLIEGNILLQDTDMDIRLGQPVRPVDLWNWFDRRLVRRVARRAASLEDFFSLHRNVGGWDGRLWNRQVRRTALRVRDEYMVEMYAGVTVNLSHLASRIIFRLLDQEVEEVELHPFHLTLYLAVKALQSIGGAHLHRSLKNPEAYEGLLRDECPGLTQLIETAMASELVERSDDTYRFLPKLRREHDFDEVRVENSIAVYANEAEPNRGVTRAVDSAIPRAPRVTDSELGRLCFDDEMRAFAWDREAFNRPEYEDVNRDETATLSGEPFLLASDTARRELGVVLIHGFTASPAEVRPLGDRLAELGYPEVGVRLKGHGTSPWDLSERRWEDWLASVRRGYEIMSVLASQVCLVGFSAGGALAMGGWRGRLARALESLLMVPPSRK
jgi:hypothetical protein